jgi:hypothetical protein
MKIKFLAITLCAMLLAAACTPAAVPTPTSFNDPYAYCKAVGTIDQPDARYTGEAQPPALADALKKALGVPADAPMVGMVWRCVNGSVLACTVGANLPCQSKANTDKTPTEAETAFCKENPTSDFIPAAVTGHDAIYAWKCVNGTAVAGEQVFSVDEQGFVKEIWYTLPNP